MKITVCQLHNGRESLAADWARLVRHVPVIALGTRPADYGNVRYSADFWWNEDEGIIELIHVKSRLTSEKGSWEASWYDKAAPVFDVAQ